MPNPSEQDWHTEFYRGMEVHVTALPHSGSDRKWDFSVRIAQPAEDAGSASELTASSGDDADYESKEIALAAGLKKGYEMIDRMLAP